MKFAAQVFREALDSRSFESFRVALLDATSLLWEISVQAKLVIEGITSPSSLAPCLEELKYLVKHDPVVNELIDIEYTHFLSKFHGDIKDPSTLKEMSAFAQMLHEKSDGSYGETIEVTLSEMIKTQTPNDDIRKTVNYYCAHLLNDGYSRDYISNNVEDWFFGRVIRKIEQRTTSRFLDRFNQGDHEYTVLIKVTDAFANYISQLSMAKITSSAFPALSADAKTKLSAAGFGISDKFVRLQLEAKDPIKAVTKGLKTIDVINSVGYLESRAISPSPAKNAYVIRRHGRTGEIFEKEKVFQIRRAKSVNAHEIRRLRTRLRTVMKELTRGAQHRFFSALSMAGLAAETEKEESQFIALWSALEVLLGNPERGGNRGSHYISTIVPCLASGYVSRYVEAILGRLRLDYGRDIRKFFLQAEFQGIDTTKKKFVILNFDDSFAHMLPAFDSIFVGNPLAAYRLRKLRDNFSSPQVALDSIEQFQQRVLWQTNRIYRVRNSIVHAGSPPRYLPALTQNVFETFRVTSDAILRHCASSGMCGDITQATLEIGFQFEIKLRTLKQRNKAQLPFTRDDLMMLFI